ncbi:SpoIIE family protein phosphatase [Pontibacillus salicampi]|uniref:SpoIIE family protein phosphatase n=1 Tax=Pontibacillus salicampi TaxID=1449801 RepID=A0ABV6LMT3_9BACI
MNSENSRVEIAIHQEPKKGNYYCGDSYFYQETDQEFVCALADGLGSGEYALESSKAVMETIQEYIHHSIDTIITKCNEVLSNKRGAVLGLLRMNFEEQRYSFTSIGNIGIITMTPDGKKKRNIPTAGYLSGYPRQYRVTKDQLSPGLLFFMFSDGVNERTLSSKTFISQNPDNIMSSFRLQHATPNEDDTTFIAMKYQP